MIENIEIYKLFATYGIGFAMWGISVLCCLKYKNVIFGIVASAMGLLLYDLNHSIAFFMIVIGVVTFIIASIEED